MTYEKNKNSIMKWRDANPDAYRDYLRVYSREHYNEDAKKYKQEYYLANKDKIKAKKLIKEEIQEIMNILL